VPGAAGVWVATDDERIASEVERFGGQVIMTSADCANGTERCADAVASLGDIADVIVNLQGDAPLSPHHVVADLVDGLSKDDGAAMATPAVPCTRASYAHLLSDRAEGRVGGTTVVFNADHRALYFSKEVIPFIPGNRQGDDFPPVHLHLGIYAYRRDSLDRYRNAPSTTLEQLEGLEQLRFLEIGLPISIVRVDPLNWDPIELNNPSDVPHIERMLSVRGIE